jgi:hypothetical protein
LSIALGAFGARFDADPEFDKGFTLLVFFLPSFLGLECIGCLRRGDEKNAPQLQL